MKRFERLFRAYQDQKKTIEYAIKNVDWDIKDLSKNLNVSVSTTYSKLNGYDVLIHKDYIVFAELLKIDPTPLLDYADYLSQFSVFIETNDIFKQVYFLKIINKDNIGLKKRFKNPLVWKAEEIIAILEQVQYDLENSPFAELVGN